jgi:hypothetical protein
MYFVSGWSFKKELRNYTVHLFEKYVYMNYFLGLWVSWDMCVTMYQNEVRVTYLSYSAQTIYSYQNMNTNMLHVTIRHNVHIAGWHMMSKREPLATSCTSCSIVFKMLKCKIRVTNKVHFDLWYQFDDFWHFQNHSTNVTLFWRFKIVFPAGLELAHSLTRSGITVIKDANLKIQARK